MQSYRKGILATTGRRSRESSTHTLDSGGASGERSGGTTGPHLDRPAVDASGESDFGNIDAWFQEGHVDHLEGAWGTVRIRGATQTVKYLD